MFATSSQWYTGIYLYKFFSKISLFSFIVDVHVKPFWIIFPGNRPLFGKFCQGFPTWVGLNILHLVPPILSRTISDYDFSKLETYSSIVRFIPRKS